MAWPIHVRCVICSWLSYTEEVASDLPLGGDIVQRLQRFGTYGRLKQIALRKVAHNIASDSALVSDLRKAFQQLDTAGTGELASRQVTCMYALQNSSSNACSWTLQAQVNLHQGRCHACMCYNTDSQMHLSIS